MERVSGAVIAGCCWGWGGFVFSPPARKSCQRELSSLLPVQVCAETERWDQTAEEMRARYKSDKREAYLLVVFFFFFLLLKAEE